MSSQPWDDDPKYATVLPPESIETSKAGHTLDKGHLAVFERAVTNILSIDLAQLTFTQLVDGLPLWDVVFALDHYGLVEDEPVYKHRELCPGALDKTKAFREAFDPAMMEIRTDVLNRYQFAPVGSRASKLPLIELVVVAVHAIAVQIFKQVDGGFHRDEKYPDDDFYKKYSWCRRKPTPFSLWRYDDPEQYPDGNADIAGYWVEDQIFGGIVLFDRGESGLEQNGVWFHSSRRDITDHVYALRDEQTASLIRFLESEPAMASSVCPFPILGDRDSVRRDWELSIPKYNIYRDRWERKIRYRSYRWYKHSQSFCRACDEDSVENPEWGAEGFL